MSYRTTLLLLGACIVLTAAFEYSESGLLHRLDRGLAQPFRRFREDYFASIRIEGGDDTIQLERDGAEWQLTEPLRFPVRSSRMQSLLNDIRHFRQRAEVGRDTGSYGLAASTTRLVVVDRHGRSQEIVFGDEYIEGDERLCYFSYDGGVWLCDLDFVERMRRRTVDEMRDRALFRVLPSGAKRLEIERHRLDTSQKQVVLAKSEQGWQMSSPDVARGDDFGIVHILRVLASWGIEEFVSDDPEAWQQPEYGLTDPRYRVRIGGGGNADEVAVGSAVPGTDGAEVYAGWVATKNVFRVSAEPVVLLEQPSLLFRERGLFAIDAPALHRMRFGTADGLDVVVEVTGVEYDRMRIGTAGQWLPVESSWFQQVSARVRAMELDAIVDKSPGPQAYGFDRPRLTIEVEPVDGVRETVVIGNGDAATESFFVFNTRWDHYGRAKLPVREVLDHLPHSLRARNVIGQPLDQKSAQPMSFDVVRRLRVSLADGTQVTFERLNVDWRRESRPRDLGRDAALVAELVAQLATMSVARWSQPSSEFESLLKLEILPLPGDVQFDPVVLELGHTENGRRLRASKQWEAVLNPGAEIWGRLEQLVRRTAP